MKLLPASFTLWAALGAVAVVPASAQIVLNYRYDVGTAVPDGGELLDARTVAGHNGPIAKASVSVNLSPIGAGGGFNGDLYVALGHVDQLAVLVNRAGKLASGQLGYSDGSGMTVRFSEGAALGDVHVYRERLSGNASTPLTGPLTGEWEPDGRLIDPETVELGTPRTAGLSVLELLEMTGEYRLLVADASLGGLHRLDSWGLHLQVADSHVGGLEFVDTEVTVLDAAPRVVANAVTLGGGVVFGGAQAMTFNGPVVLAGSQTVQTDTAVTFGGGVGESGGAARLTKAGSGTLTLAGEGTYSGGTDVAQGRLVLENTTGSATGSGNLWIRSGAELSGSGRMTGQLLLESGATLRPGTSPGTITVGSWLWEGGGRLEIEMDSVTDVAGLDAVVVTGGLTFDVTPENPVFIDVVSLLANGQAGLADGFDPAGHYVWTIITTGGGITGYDERLVRIDASRFVGGDPAEFRTEVRGNNLVLTYAVPEPATGWLAGLGAAAMVWRRRFQLRRA